MIIVFYVIYYLPLIGFIYFLTYDIFKSRLATISYPVILIILPFIDIIPFYIIFSLLVMVYGGVEGDIPDPVDGFLMQGYECRYIDCAEDFIVNNNYKFVEVMIRAPKTTSLGYYKLFLARENDPACDVAKKVLSARVEGHKKSRVPTGYCFAAQKVDKPTSTFGYRVKRNAVRYLFDIGRDDVIVTRLSNGDVVVNAVLYRYNLPSFLLRNFYHGKGEYYPKNICPDNYYPCYQVMLPPKR